MRGSGGFRSSLAESGDCPPAAAHEKITMMPASSRWAALARWTLNCLVKVKVLGPNIANQAARMEVRLKGKVDA
jgi:hypothetical protein